jgi:hypothetical protein
MQHANDAQQHAEGPVAEAIEEQTAKLPSDLFLWTAAGAAGLSVLLHLAGRKEAGNFVAQWTPTILIVGLYNKFVKLHGHDRADGEGDQSDKGEEGKVGGRMAEADSAVETG